VYAGTPLTPNDLNGGKAALPACHNVYIYPERSTYCRSIGSFRDGTILIKELVSDGSKAAVGGKRLFARELMGLEATIKSGKQFPDEPRNWAFLSFSTQGAAV
ncbi:MAG: cytochrome P460 family protein, partial [Pseudomonadota bacterium]